MSENFGWKEKIIHAISELPPVDRFLRERAKEIITQTRVKEYLKDGGSYLDVGTGKGHIIELIENDLKNEGRQIKTASIDVGDKPLRRVQKRMGETRERESEKNPMDFMWAQAENLPFRENSFDGVSFFFALHHMSMQDIDKALREAIRVTHEGENTRIFVAEDLVETAEQRSFTEEMDRKVNLEGKDEEHNYRSDKEWEDYFSSLGLKVVDRNFFESKYKGGVVKHGFYVLGKAGSQGD